MRFGLTSERAEAELGRLEREGRLVRGELRPGGAEREWCEPDVLRRLRRASLAALRKEVEPVDDEPRSPASCPAGTASTGGRRCGRRSSRCKGLSLPVSLWETDVLPAACARVPARAARPAHRLGRGRVGRCGARAGRSLLPRGRARPGPPRRASSTGGGGARPHPCGARWQRALLVRPASRDRARRRDARCRPCGSSSGPAR